MGKSVRQTFQWQVRLPARVSGLLRVASLFAMLAVLASGNALAAAPEFRKAPAPGWVEAVALPEKYQTPGAQVSGGAYYLLVDSQTRVEASRKLSFRRFAIRMLSAEGVQDNANIEIPFDPSYQSLTLHSIQLIRDGRVIDKLPGAAVSILQREESLELLIYDGGKTANVFLDDVRVGDVVDYSYSIIGDNPVFGGRQFGEYQLRWGLPLELRTVRLLVPDGRPIKLHSRNGAACRSRSRATATRNSGSAWPRCRRWWWRRTRRAGTSPGPCSNGRSSPTGMRWRAGRRPCIDKRRR